MQIETLTIEVEAGIVTANWGQDNDFELPIEKLSIQFEVGGEVIPFLTWLEHLKELAEHAKD